MELIKYIRLDADDDHVILDIPNHKQAQNIHRVIRNKNAKQNIKERSRTLHEFTLSSLLVNELRKDGDFFKIMANLKQFKNLRCLNVDLWWLEICYNTNRLGRFAESLKHLRNLSTLCFGPGYLYSSSSSSANRYLPLLLKLLEKSLDLSKMRIELIVMIDPQTPFLDFKILEDFSKLERFTSVHIHFQNVNIADAAQFLAAFRNSRCLSRLSLAINVNPSESGSGLLALYDQGLKELKSVKYFKLIISGGHVAERSLLENLLPRMKEIAKSAHLEMIFACFPREKTYSTRIEQRIFHQSIAQINSSHRIKVEFLGPFPLFNYWLLLIFFVVPAVVLALLGLMLEIISFEDLKRQLAIIGILAILIFYFFRHFDLRRRIKKLLIGKALMSYELENLSPNDGEK